MITLLQDLTNIKPWFPVANWQLIWLEAIPMKEKTQNNRTTQSHSTMTFKSSHCKFPPTDLKAEYGIMTNGDNDQKDVGPLNHLKDLLSFDEMSNL